MDSMEEAPLTGVLVTGVYLLQNIQELRLLAIYTDLHRPTQISYYGYGLPY